MEPFQVRGFLSGYQAPPTETKVCKNYIYIYKYDISLLVSNNDSGGGCSHSEVESFSLYICSHFSGGSTKINMVRCNPASNPTSHQEFNPMIQTASSVILLLITIKSWNHQPLSSSPEKPESSLLPIKMIILFVLCWILGETSSDHMGKVSLMMLAIHCNSAEYLQAVWTYPYNHVFMQTVDVFVQTCDV